MVLVNYFPPHDLVTQSFTHSVERNLFPLHQTAVFNHRYFFFCRDSCPVDGYMFFSFLTFRSVSGSRLSVSDPDLILDKGPDPDRHEKALEKTDRFLKLGCH